MATVLSFFRADDTSYQLQSNTKVVRERTRAWKESGKKQLEDSKANLLREPEIGPVGHAAAAAADQIRLTPEHVLSSQLLRAFLNRTSSEAETEALLLLVHRAVVSKSGHSPDDIHVTFSDDRVTTFSRGNTEISHIANLPDAEEEEEAEEHAHRVPLPISLAWAAAAVFSGESATLATDTFQDLVTRLTLESLREFTSNLVVAVIGQLQVSVHLHGDRPSKLEWQEITVTARDTKVTWDLDFVLVECKVKALLRYANLLLQGRPTILRTKVTGHRGDPYGHQPAVLISEQAGLSDGHDGSL
jgi:hypothetical protein